MSYRKQSASFRKRLGSSRRLPRAAGGVLCFGVFVACAAPSLQQARAQNAPPANVALVPTPQQAVWSGSPFVLNPATSIVYVDAPGLLSDARMLAGHLRASTGYAIPIKTKAAEARAKPNTIVLTENQADPALGPQGYQLQATASNVVIRGSSFVGVFYGTQTLRQLLPMQIENPTLVKGVSWIVPGVSISDAPRFPERGLMLDSSRYMQSVGFIKRTIDDMAYQKMNMFHWHLVDDDGWRIEIKSYPKLMSIGAYRFKNGVETKGGFYTQAQIRDIVAFAAARGVTIVPEMDIPGHSNEILASYPELGTGPGPYSNSTWTSDTMDPGKEATYTFIDNVLTEIMTLFPGPEIHIGGDEVATASWKASPDCQAMMKKEHLADLSALKDYCTRRVADFMRQHGRRVEKWTDWTDGNNLAPDTIVEEWNIPGIAVDDAKNGNDVIVADVTGFYFDSGDDTPTMQKVYQFDPMAIMPGLTPDLTRHMIGVEACMWTENCGDDRDCDSGLWPRMVPLAMVEWSQPSVMQSWPDFKTSMLTSYFPRLALVGLGVPEPAAQVQHDLTVRSGFDWGTQVGEWSPKTVTVGDSSEDYDITSQIKGSGLYVFRAAYQPGTSGILVEGVDLLKNGDRVKTVFIREGRAGEAPYWTTFYIPIPDVDPQAKYTVRLHFRTDGGHTDTAGTVWLQGPD